MNLYRLIVLAHIIIFASIIAAGKCHGSPSNIISDSDFTNQSYEFENYLKFYKQFPKNKLTYQEKCIIISAAHYFEISPWVIMAKLQNESDLIGNYGGSNRYEWRKIRAAGYGLKRHFWLGYHPTSPGKYKFYKYGGYQIQVFHMAKLLRKSFDAWTPGKTIKLLCTDEIIIPLNASTYAILVYNPFYYKHEKYGYPSTGSLLFEQLFNKYKGLK